MTQSQKKPAYIAAHIRRVLDERPSQRAPSSRFLRELEDYLSEEEAGRVLEVVDDLARVAALDPAQTSSQALHEGMGLVEKKLLKVTPAQYAKDAHHWLILHGRYVCKARKPECARCVVFDLCAFKGKTT